MTDDVATIREAINSLFDPRVQVAGLEALGRLEASRNEHRLRADSNRTDLAAARQERDEYVEDVVVAEIRAKVAEDDLDKWVGRAESAESALAAVRQELAETLNIARDYNAQALRMRQEREELRDWLFSQKQALDEARAERARLREALQDIAQGKYAMEAGRRAAEALAALPAGDEQ